MTLDEFITLFKNRKITVHVHNQIEKTDVLRFVRTSVFHHSLYDLAFDPDYQYVGISKGCTHVCCWHNPALAGADSIEYDEFCAIVDWQEETVDEKSILSLL